MLWVQTKSGALLNLATCNLIRSPSEQPGGEWIITARVHSDDMVGVATQTEAIIFTGTEDECTKWRSDLETAMIDDGMTVFKG